MGEVVAGPGFAGPFTDPAWREQLAELADGSRQQSRAFAADALTIASLASRVPRGSGDPRGGTDWTSFVREIALARRITDRAATSEIDIALDLVRRFPTALGLLEEGRLPVAQAKALVSHSAHCDDLTAMGIDNELALKACTQPAWKVRQQVQQLLASLDADAVADRAARATADRDLQLTPGHDDQASLWLTGPAPALTAYYTSLDTQARALRAAGDPRTLAQLRFDLAVAPATTPGWPTPPGPPPTTATPPTPDEPIQTPPADTPAQPATPADAVPTDAAPTDAVPSATSPAGPGLAQPATTPLGLPLRPAAPADLAGNTHLWTDRRLRRPVQLIIHVPVTTALGLTNEPGWLEGYGWLSAPQVRQLLPVAELRQACTTPGGQLIDLADKAVRPPPTPTGARDALITMATQPFDITDKTWREEPQHDPSPALREFTQLRDRFCDGPTPQAIRAHNCDLDHVRPHPEGPTAAWNLTARARRTHALKHFGWTDIPTPTGTMWISPAGQIALTDRDHNPPPPIDPDAQLPTPTSSTTSNTSSCANPHPPTTHP